MSTSPTPPENGADDPRTAALAPDRPAPEQSAPRQSAPEQPAPDRPEPDRPELDQTERVILRSAEEEGGPGCPCDLLVVDDPGGALTAAALELLDEHPEARVIAWNRSRAETAALAARFVAPVEAGRLLLPRGDAPTPLEQLAAGTSPHLVLARLPKSLAALEDLAVRLARFAAAADRTDLTLVAGGRVKHMTRSQNEVLARAFGSVRASRGLGKSRALVAAQPLGPEDLPGVAGELRAGDGALATTASSDPAEEAPPHAAGSVAVPVRGERRELSLRGVGGVFGGARADAGSLLLLDSLERVLTVDDGGDGAGVGTAVDLGCGNGLLTAYLAAAFPDAQVLGSDDDADAVASTRATLAATGLDRDGVRVTWDDSLGREPADSADLVLLNPPFHDGTAVDATLVQGLLDAAARVLRPGGQLWFVHNSHLRYRPELEARFGQVRQRARDRRFTVLSARR